MGDKGESGVKRDKLNRPERPNKPERPDWEVKMGKIQFQGLLPLMIFCAIVIAGLCFGLKNYD